MSEFEKAELIRRISAMSEDEKKLVVDNLPMELIFERLRGEYERLNTTLESMRTLICG